MKITLPEFRTIQKLAGGNTVSGRLVINGGIQLAYAAKTANYTIVPDSDYCVNCTTGSFTVTLPTASGIAGQAVIVKNSGTGTITIATTSSQTIDGDTTRSLSQYEAFGAIIALIDPGASATPFGLDFHCPFYNGLTVVTAGTPDITVIYE